jgi:hypothetical protein
VANFLNVYEVVLNFKEKYFSTNKDDVLSRHMFFYDSMTWKGMEGEIVSNPNRKLNNFNVKSPINLEGSCPHTCVRRQCIYNNRSFRLPGGSRHSRTKGGATGASASGAIGKGGANTVFSHDNMIPRSYTRS